MGKIQKAISVYEKVRKNKYTITVEDGTIITLNFGRENFHHLLGFQHLTDKPALSYQVKNTKAFYNGLRRGYIAESEIESSEKYADIADRVEYFHELLDILSAGDAKIIVEFDPAKIKTLIEAKFILYKRNGLPYEKDYRVYTLFIGYNPTDKEYYPTTYVVEPSNFYLDGQRFLGCRIETTPKCQKQKKRCKTTQAKKQTRNHSYPTAPHS